MWLKGERGEVEGFVVIKESFVSLWIKKSILTSLFLPYWLLKEYGFSSLG